MAAFYNEIDPYAAQWLRNLIAAGHIAHGIVDERSISDITPAELAGYTQCHFFAGIGVWSYALRMAGWPDDRPVWTGSCPCQPFSVAGRSAGVADNRHLWPHWAWLIEQCRPAVVFGEQVEAAIKHGWLDLVQSDMEGLGYAFGAAGFPSAGVGAPHVRQRLWFVGHNIGAGLEKRVGVERVPSGASDADPGQTAVGTGVHVGALGDFWSNAEWIYCRDDKWRPVEPGTCPLAHGAPSRVGRLRAYGNSINAEAAKEWITACTHAMSPT